MKLLKEYIKELQNLVEDHPEAGNYIVITAGDDEGNSYTEVVYDPSIGIWDEGEWVPLADLEDGVEDLNAVCVN